MMSSRTIDEKRKAFQRRRKAYRYTVRVPSHWYQKGKFLQGKRGIGKQPFRLPDFIAVTGIEKVRKA